jgi:hypothetical protein
VLLHHDLAPVGPGCDEKREGPALPYVLIGGAPYLLTSYEI